MNIEFLTNDKQYKEKILSFINEWNNDLDFIEIKTSGSTGKPKTIRILKKHMTASARMTGNFLELKKGDTALLCLSPLTVAGKMMIVRSIVLDLELIVTDVSSKPLEKINTTIDFAAMVPLQAQNSVRDLSKIKKLIIGGGTISNQLWNSICQQNVDAYQTFGMTETISHIAMRKISSDSVKYIPLEGITLNAFDNCLNISAPDLGIENLQTNDIVELERDGSFLWIGRNDFVVNSGGVKLHPEIIERKLTAIIEQPFFTFGIADNQLGMKLILCIEGKCNIDKNLLSSILDKFEVPKEVYYFKSFERTKSDKINRLKTIEQIEDATREIL